MHSVPHLRNNSLMNTPVIGPRLILVCGLPGSGKTTHARALEQSLPAIRLCPDDWMAALDIDLYDEPQRQKIESLQWHFGRQLLRIGLTVIIEWGTWGRAERDAFRLEARADGYARDDHVAGTPTFDVAGRRFEGETSLADLAAAIDAASAAPRPR